MYSLGDFCKAAEDFERAVAGFEAHSFRQVIQAVFSLTHIYFKTEKYSEAAASRARGMRSAAEWEDEIYMTKFRLIKELYQGKADRIRSKSILTFWNQKSCWLTQRSRFRTRLISFINGRTTKRHLIFSAGLSACKKAANEQLRIMKKERGSFGFIVLL